jgi:hypothetical protein
LIRIPLSNIFIASDLEHIHDLIVELLGSGPVLCGPVVDLPVIRRQVYQPLQKEEKKTDKKGRKFIYLLPATYI